MLGANVELAIPVSDSSTIWLHISNSSHQNVTKKNTKHLSKFNQKQSQVAITCTTVIMVLCKALLVLKGYAQRNLSLKSIECNATVRDSQIIQFNK